MHKKLFVKIMASLLIVVFMAAFEENTSWHRAYETGTEIFFGNKKLQFDSPIVNIDGQTYVPLREAAENEGLFVSWRESLNAIEVIDGRKTFEKELGFALPEDAKITNFEYHGVQRNDLDEAGIVPIGELYSMDANFSCKVELTEKDFQDVLESLNNNYIYVEEENVVADIDDGIGCEVYMLLYNANCYDWWKVKSVDDILYFYWGVKHGEETFTLITRIAVCKGNDDLYYLYVKR